MDSKDVGWTTFWNEAAAFSNSFQQQMSEQLRKSFDLRMGIDNAAKSRSFMLFVGMEEMNISYKGGFAFAKVEVCCPDSSVRVVSACWKIENPADLLIVTRKDTWTAANIEFGWSDDFDKEYFLSFFKPKNNLKKQKNDLAFDVEYNFELYPDISLTFCCKDRFSKAETEQIQNLLMQNISNAYISEIVLAEDNYCGIIDFQGSAFEKGKEELITALQKISKEKFSENIKAVRIE